MIECRSLLIESMQGQFTLQLWRKTRPATAHILNFDQTHKTQKKRYKITKITYRIRLKNVRCIADFTHENSDFRFSLSVASRGCACAVTALLKIKRNHPKIMDRRKHLLTLSIIVILRPVPSKSDCTPSSDHISYNRRTSPSSQLSCRVCTGESFVEDMLAPIP